METLKVQADWRVGREELLGIGKMYTELRPDMEFTQSQDIYVATIEFPSDQEHPQENHYKLEVDWQVKRITSSRRPPEAVTSLKISKVVAGRPAGHFDITLSSKTGQAKLSSEIKRPSATDEQLFTFYAHSLAATVRVGK